MSNPPKRADFELALEELLIEGRDIKELEYRSITARQLHEKVGGYPGRDHRMPVCCGVMRDRMGPDDKIVDQPSKGDGASLKIKYKL